MKEPKKIELPREVWMGPKVISKVVEVCKRLDLGRRALIVADSNTFKFSGSGVKSQLEKTGIGVDHILVDEADLATVAKVRKMSRDKVDFFLGVGGGKCIDVAKLASFQEGKPFVSVPTAASHDGIASSRASIKGEKKSSSIETHAPIAIVADTLIIKRAPRRLLAAGCGDILSNLTAVRDWQLAHRVKGEPYSEYAAMLSLVSYRLVMENAEVIRSCTEESVREVVKALISSSVAMAIAGSSRPASGAEHLFSHALDNIAPKPALHGEQCGVGTIMMAYLHGEDWIAVKRSLKTIGAPTNARELGIPAKYVVKALTLAQKNRPDRYTVLSGGLNRESAERLAKTTEVI